MSLFDRLARLFGGDQPAQGPPDERALQLASAVLLFQVAMADHQLEPAELERLRQVLATEFQLDETALAELVEAAEDVAEEGISLDRELDLLNRRLDSAAKFRVMVGLWQIAFADEQLHHYEEHLIRRLADLLHVPHSEFIRAKHVALNRR
ncbi:MAG: TerB family tellurite resistance protein [Gammaproteobacteria bacterium]|nr:MAG: TerB family tellurite resistance protein [Gammaproteobacteria bacterium]